MYARLLNFVIRDRDSVKSFMLTNRKGENAVIVQERRECSMSVGEMVVRIHLAASDHLGQIASGDGV